MACSTQYIKEKKQDGRRAETLHLYMASSRVNILTPYNIVLLIVKSTFTP